MNDLDRIFAKLTPAQQRLMAFQGWTWSSVLGRPQPHRATAKALIRKGLMVQHILPLGPGITVFEYEVPIPIHIAWCAYCSRKFDETKALTSRKEAA